VKRIGDVSVCYDFATTRLALMRFIQRIREFSSREICFYVVKADYALYLALSPRLDTVGVWGSNPHAPTIFIELVRYFRPPLRRSRHNLADFWQTLKNLSRCCESLRSFLS